MISPNAVSLEPWPEEKMMRAQMLWSIHTLPLWFIARSVETSLVDLCSQVKEQPDRFPIERCSCRRVPTAEEIDDATRLRLTSAVASLLGLRRSTVEEVAQAASSGSNIRTLLSTFKLPYAEIELIVRSFGYAPPIETSAGLAQFRLILSETDLAAALGISTADVTFVEHSHREGTSVYRFLKGGLTVESVNLILEWSGIKARWRTTVTKRKWWRSATAILKRYDQGESIQSLSKELGIEHWVMYHFLHRHHRQPFKRLQAARHGLRPV